MDITVHYRRTNGVEETARFSSQQEIIIGRPKAIPIQVDLGPDLKVSRPHARLFYRLSAWWVEDLQSKHGTYLNGERIAKPSTLATGDKLRLGETTLHIDFASCESLPPEGAYETDLAIDEVKPSDSVSEDDRLTLLERYSKISANQTRLSGLLDRYVEELSVTFPKADHCAIVLEEDRELVVRSAQPRSVAPVSFTLLREAMSSQRALHWVRALAADGGHVISLNDTVAALCAPIPFSGRAVGAVYLGTSRPDVMFTAKDAALLGEVANLMAAPIVAHSRGDLPRIPGVFMSYAAADRAVVNRLASELRRRRVRVWLDERLQSWRSRSVQIREAIRATDAILLMVSPASIAAPQVLEEMEIALGLGKPILPLRVQPCNLPQVIADRSPIEFGPAGQDLEAAASAVEQAVYNLMQPVNQESKTRILFFAANPINTEPLHLNVEVRTIDERLRQSEYRDRFELIQHWAVRAGDLSEFLLRHKPHIVHFAGHGSEAGEIVLEDDRATEARVPPRALAQLFRILKDNVRVVVLNACLSLPQARAIAKEIDCVVGMTREIDDEAAIKFAGGFYRALGYGRSVQAAFELGCNEIDLSVLSNEGKPKLLTRSGVNAANVFLV